MVPEEGLEPSHTRVRQILREHNGVSALVKHLILLPFVSVCILIDAHISGKTDVKLMSGKSTSSEVCGCFPRRA